MRIEHTTQIDTLRRTCERFSVTLPAAVTEAEATLAAARALRQTITTEAEPATTGLTAANIAKRAEAIAQHRATHEHRVAAAAHVTGAAEQAVIVAWRGAEDALHAELAARFTDAAERFTTALDALGGVTDMEANVRAGRGDQHRVMEEAADELHALRLARRTLHGRAELGDQHFWDWTQVLGVDSVETANRLRHAVGSPGLHQPAPAPGSAAWWAALVTADGVTGLRWHTPAEQTALRARTPTRRPTAAVTA